MSEKKEKRQLTKKNEEFIFQFKKHLAKSGKLDAEQIEKVVIEVEDELLATQHTGRTAQQLYGTPTLAVQKYLDPKRHAKKLHDFGFLPLAIDTILVIFMLFAFVFGVTLFFSKENNAGAGILSLLTIAILGGTVYTYALLKLTPNPDEQKPTVNKGKRWLFLAGAIVVWLLGFVIVGIMPPIINPTLPPIAYIILGALAYGGFYYNRQKNGLKGNGFFAIGQLSNQSRFEAQQKNNQK